MRPLLLMLSLAAGCGGGTDGAAEVSFEAEEAGLAECAVCGMVVREQPAPRGQVVHRGGEHRHFCSVGDLRAYVQAPSPLGEPRAIYVEVLPTDFDPAAYPTDPLSYRPVEDVLFVFGAEQPQVMGVAALTFEDEPAARAAAELLGTAPVRWDAVLSTPFNEIPR